MTHVKNSSEQEIKINFRYQSLRFVLCIVLQMQYVFIFFVTSYAFTFTHNSRNFHFYSHIHFHFHMLKVEIVFGGFLRQKLMYSLWRVVWDKKFVHTFSVSICWWSFACRLREHVLTKKNKKKYLIYVRN